MDIKIGEDYWEIVPEEHRLAAEFIHKTWILAGKPNRLETEGAWKIMDSIMKILFKVSTTTSNFMIGVTAAALS